MTTVRIPAPLRKYTDGRDELRADGATVGEILRQLAERHEGLGAQVLAGDGALRSFVNVFVGARNVKSLDGLRSAVAPDDVVTIVPAVAGGTAP
jgi:molybdopterin converting factor small subunit